MDGGELVDPAALDLIYRVRKECLVQDVLRYLLSDGRSDLFHDFGSQLKLGVRKVEIPFCP